MEMNWYRVVLDEAQNIKNQRTRASRVVTHLIADIRYVQYKHLKESIKQILDGA
jgi:SNF2 family DNA or RNA helicase